MNFPENGRWNRGRGRGRRGGEPRNHSAVQKFTGKLHAYKLTWTLVKLGIKKSHSKNRSYWFVIEILDSTTSPGNHPLSFSLSLSDTWTTRFHQLNERNEDQSTFWNEPSIFQESETPPFIPLSLKDWSKASPDEDPAYDDHVQKFLPSQSYHFSCFEEHTNGDPA